MGFSWWLARPMSAAPIQVLQVLFKASHGNMQVSLQVSPGPPRTCPTPVPLMYRCAASREHGRVRDLSRPVRSDHLITALITSSSRRPRGATTRIMLSYNGFNGERCSCGLIRVTAGFLKP